LTAYDRTTDIAGAVGFSATFQLTGDITEGTA
jgi:hypothetical protein